MTTRTCAICGETKDIKFFGQGLTVPATTCLSCFEALRPQNNPKPQADKKERVDPVTEYLEELKNV